MMYALKVLLAKALVANVSDSQRTQGDHVITIK